MRFALALAFAVFLCLPTPAMADRPVSFAAAPPPGAALVLPLGSKSDLARYGAFVDAATRTVVARALDDEDFDYARGSNLHLRAIGPWPRILVIGTGGGILGSSALQDLGGTAMQQLAAVGAPIAVLTAGLPADGGGAGAQIAVGAKLGGYAFNKYKSAEPGKATTPAPEAPLVIVGAASAAWERDGRALVDAVTFSRDLIREPANVIYPESFVQRTQQAFRGVRGATVQVLDVPAMERLGMGSILSVGLGSKRPSRLLIVRYEGNSAAPLVALAGKGITFDSGGISLKPGTGMWAMKGDMAGAAAVIGTALSLARSRAPVNVVAIAALAENMPGGSATRPGDVVRAYNGKTIEVLNTDAEGRLVLADAVAYAERQFRPAAIVDVATLTGAVSTALGDEYAGLFSDNDALAQQLATAGAATGEELWRLPLHANYAKDMKSDIADIKNVVEGGAPGAGFGAHFIGYFVETTPWAHLDIASVDQRSSSLPTVPEGLSGFGVRLLDRFVRDFRQVPAAATPGAGN